MTLFQRILRAVFPPIAPLPRADSPLFGFYAADRAQVDETADCTDIFWCACIPGEAEMFDAISAAKKPTVLDLTGYMFTREVGEKFKLRPDAEQQLMALRNRLADAGILRNINWIAPIDEPDINTTPDDQHAANMIARRVFFDAKLAVIFATVQRLTHIQDYDLVGFDDYPERERIFDITLPWPPMSDYDRLISRLRPDQRVILVPGGGDPWRQDPAPFIAKAREDGRVAMLIGFVWFRRYDTAPEPFALGIRENGMAETYRGVCARLK